MSICIYPAGLSFSKERPKWFAGLQSRSPGKSLRRRREERAQRGEGRAVCGGEAQDEREEGPGGSELGRRGGGKQGGPGPDPRAGRAAAGADGAEARVAGAGRGSRPVTACADDRVPGRACWAGGFRAGAECRGLIEETE